MYTETSIYIYFYLRDLFFDVGTNVHMHETLDALYPPFLLFFVFLETALDTVEPQYNKFSYNKLLIITITLLQTTFIMNYWI